MCLESVEEKGQARPTTGNIDFCVAKKAFKRAKNKIVITKVDKAANCLCIMCKSCYKRVVMQELDSPGYTRVEGDNLETIMDNIIERQQEYLNKECLPIPNVCVALLIDGLEKILEKSSKVLVRYLMPKLHKAKPAFRGITSCCGTITEGIAKRVNAILVGIRPVLHAIWRKECLRIGIVAKECWITSGGSIVELMRDMDKKTASVTPIGENKLPHQLETFDFVAMYPDIPVSCLKRVMKHLLELVSTYEQVTYGYISVYVKFGYEMTR